MRARCYHPALGRFLTPDAIIPDPTNGQAWNRYAYVYNDPLTYTDPSGHWAVIARIGMTLAVGAAVAAYAEWYMNRDLARQQWWNTVPTCDCTPPAWPTLDPLFFMGLTPGASMSVAMAMGLAEDVTRKIVPGPHKPVSQSYIDRVIENDWKYGDRTAYWRQELDDLLRTGQAKTVSSVNYGVGEGIGSASGTMHLKADGAVLSSGLLDMGLQLFFDRDVCLSPRQKFYRALTAAGLGMAAAGFGTAAAATATTTTGAALRGVGMSVGMGFINERVIKPIIFNSKWLR